MSADSAMASPAQQPRIWIALWDVLGELVPVVLGRAQGEQGAERQPRVPENVNLQPKERKKYPQVLPGKAPFPVGSHTPLLLGFAELPTASQLIPSLSATSPRADVCTIHNPRRPHKLAPAHQWQH